MPIQEQRCFMGIPKYKDIGSIPAIVQWFIEHDEKVKSELWDIDKCKEDLIQWNVALFSENSSKKTKESINYIFHQFNFTVLPQMEELLHKRHLTPDEEETLNYLRIQYILQTAQLRVSGWIFWKKYNSQFVPYGNPFEVLGILKDFVDYYEILGIESTATLEDIKRAYRSKARSVHPDVGGDAESFKAVKDAYDTLKDQQKRKKYDETYLIYQRRQDYNLSFDDDYKNTEGEDEFYRPTLSFNWKGYLRGIGIAIFLLVIIKALFALNNEDPTGPYISSETVNSSSSHTTSPDLVNTTNASNSLSNPSTSTPEKEVAWGNMENRMKNVQDDLASSYKEYAWNGVNLEPIFSIYQSERNNGEPVVVVVGGISKRGFEHLIQSPTRDSDIQSIMHTFKSKPIEEFKNEDILMMLILSDYFEQKPEDNPLFAKTTFNQENRGWNGTQLIGAWSTFEQQLVINQDLPSSFSIKTAASSGNEQKASNDKPKISDPTQNSKKEPPTEKKKLTYFSLGSSEQEVESIMGTPKSIIGSVWSYELSSVYFDFNRKVEGWSNISNNLKVSIGVKKNGAPPFSLGSNTNQVIEAMGTPLSIIGGAWGYGFSNVYFDFNGNVEGWSNISNNLRVFIGNKKQNAPPFTIGSTMNQVIEAMGTPSSITGSVWGFRYSSVYFDSNGKVEGWSDISKNLKIK
jgi:curved DNA-binding protein CbpA